MKRSMRSEKQPCNLLARTPHPVFAIYAMLTILNKRTDPILFGNG